MLGIVMLPSDTMSWVVFIASMISKTETEVALVSAMACIALIDMAFSHCSRFTCFTVMVIGGGDVAETNCCVQQFNVTTVLSSSSYVDAAMAVQSAMLGQVGYDLIY